LIVFSPTARGHIASLRRHYEDRERPDAIRNLIRAMEDVAARISRAPGKGLMAPRPYPSLLRPGLRWLKAGPYWVAYMSRDSGAVVEGVFHESADIPNRL
jgi:plasmid stabilization system protein ParE